ncbi:MAG: ClC family H(+)/Cl(-) exchange transporter [Clostridiales bacterium]|nr:ClC family H(+)/Cl(-) exchange transporter [Candidatus Crickella merdequi]
MKESNAVRNLRRRRTFKYALLAEGLVIGAITGVLVALFRLALIRADELRNQLVEYAHSGMTGALVAAAVLALIAVAVALLLVWEPECTGSGIPQVEGEMRGLIDMNWWKVLAAKFAGCVLSIGGGLALGREGPCVQLGSMVGKGFARTNKRLLTEERLLITCGAGAGLSAAFGAPLAGAIFALEELHKNFSVLVLITTMASAAVADYVAANIVGLAPVFNIEVVHAIPLRLYWTLVVFGAVLGVFGAMYNKLLDVQQDVFAKIGGFAEALAGGKLVKFTKLAAAVALSYLMFFVYPTALGSGAWLVTDISAGELALKALAVLLVVKLIYSTGCFGSGAPGGIFLPLLVLGAVAGGLYCRLLGLIGVDQMYITSFVIVGMAGFFTAIVKAPTTGIILITEMTADFSSLLALVIVSLMAFIVSDLCGADPVYEQLLEKRLRAEGKDTSPDNSAPRAAGERVVLKADIHVGALMDGGRVEDMELPDGCLIVAVIRNNMEIIPSGATKLHAGDHIEILCRKADIDDAVAVIQEKCEVRI